jgi:hypothetical protein
LHQSSSHSVIILLKTKIFTISPLINYY